MPPRLGAWRTRVQPRNTRRWHESETGGPDYAGYGSSGHDRRLSTHEIKTGRLGLAGPRPGYRQPAGRLSGASFDWYHPPARKRLARPVPHSSRGPGHRPLKAEIIGSNPICGTKITEPLVGTLIAAPRPVHGSAGRVVEPRVGCRRWLVADLWRIERQAAQDRAEAAHRLGLHGRQGMAVAVEGVMATSQVVEADRRQLGGPQERLKLASRDVPAANPPVGR